MVRTETELKDVVIGLARTMGWLVHHDLPAVNVRGRWATHVQGDVGFPDLVLVHPSGGFLVVELKGSRTRPTVNQHLWLRAFEAAGVEATIWRPDDWHSGSIADRLRRRTK